MIKNNKILFILIMILSISCGGANTNTMYPQQSSKNSSSTSKKNMYKQKDVQSVPILYDELIIYLMERGYFQSSFEKIGLYHKDIDTDYLLGLYVLMGYTITPIVNQHGIIQRYIAQLQNHEQYTVNGRLGVSHKLRDNIWKKFNIEE